MAAAASRVLRGRSDGCGFGEVKGGSRVPFIGATWHLDVRAQGEQGAGRGRTRAPPRVRFEPEVGDAPDGWGPPDGETGRGGGRLAGLGQEAGNEPAGDGNVGPGKRKRERESLLG
jgi:hypothetical protein